MKDIYEMFKSGMSTDDIYTEFMKEYDAAKVKHNEDVKRAKEEEARKAREEKEKAAAAKKITETSRKNRALPRYRDALFDAFYDYFDFLLPEPLDYEEVFPKIEKGIMDFENSLAQTLDIVQPIVDLLIKAMNQQAIENDKSDNEDEWEVDLESSLNIDGKEVSNNKTRLSSQDNLKTEAVEKHLNSFLTSLDEDKRRIHEYLNKIMKEKP